MGEPNTSHFNHTEVLQRLQGDQELLRELLGYALEDFPTYLRNIEQALEQDDRNMLHRSAHKMKGFARNMGFTRLGELALQAEQHHEAPRETLLADLEQLSDEVGTLIQLISGEAENR